MVQQEGMELVVFCIRLFKMKKQTIIIAVMGLIILGGTMVYAYNFISERAYTDGIQDATLMINQQILGSLNQSGFIPYIYRINETASVNIKLIPHLYEQSQGGEE